MIGTIKTFFRIWQSVVGLYLNAKRLYRRAVRRFLKQKDEE